MRAKIPKLDSMIDIVAMNRFRSLRQAYLQMALTILFFYLAITNYSVTFQILRYLWKTSHTALHSQLMTIFGL